VTQPRRILPLLCLALVLAAACTKGGGTTPSRTTNPTPTSPAPTGPVRFEPGEYRYAFGGVTASLSFDGSDATLEVKNASGHDLDPPGIYVIQGTGEREDGTVAGATTVADGAIGTFQVSFPKTVTEKSIGLVILEFGDANWGAMAPAPAA
jgi:hypothetical protein